MVLEHLLALALLLAGGFALLRLSLAQPLLSLRLAGGNAALLGVGAILLLKTPALDLWAATSTLPLALATVGSASQAAGWQFTVYLACLVPLACFTALTLTRPSSQNAQAILCALLLLVIGGGFVYATQLFWWLLMFELLLLTSLYLLRLTSKSDRVGEAVAEMFFWTLAGSVCLLLALGLLFLQGFTALEQAYVAGGIGTAPALLLLVGFGVKVPLWPFFSWLLKAHVEASVEFSILLSGVVVKFGALGLYRVALAQLDTLYATLLLLSTTLAIVEATLRILAQRDLKRIVALTTIIEMNWAGACLALGGYAADHVGAFILVAHSLTTTAEFFGVELIYRRWGSRDLAQVSGLAYSTPTLFGAAFITTLVTIGFPGSSLFVAKVLFLSLLMAVAPGLGLAFSLWFLVVLPVIFMRVWLPVWFGQPNPGQACADLSSRELLILLVANSLGILLGLQPWLAL